MAPDWLSHFDDDFVYPEGWFDDVPENWEERIATDEEVSALVDKIFHVEDDGCLTLTLYAKAT